MKKKLPTPEEITHALGVLNDQVLYYYSMLYERGLTSPEGKPFTVCRARLNSPYQNMVSSRVHIYVHNSINTGFYADDLTEEEILKKVYDLYDKIPNDK